MVAAARLFLSRVRPGGGDGLQAKGDGGLNLPVSSSSNPSAASSPPPPPPPPPLPLLPLPPHPSSTATSRPRPRLAVVATRFAGEPDIHLFAVFEPDIHLFAVFDGHGACAAACSGFARDGLPRLLLLAAEDDASGGSLLASDLAGAFRAAMVGVNEEMHAAAVDDSMSGTTAVAALVAGGALHVANVGDSRAVAGVWRDGRVAAEELSWDQTPFRADERARVKACSARVMSVEQVEGVRDPDAEGWLAYEGDPPRVWARDGLYPGTAFTRSLADLAAEGAGVIADPEVKTVEITPAHLFFAVASDGVFEFLSSQEVVDMTVQNVRPTSPYLAKQILFCTPTRCLMKIPEGWQGRIGL